MLASVLFLNSINLNFNQSENCVISGLIECYTLINNFNQQSLLDSLGRYQKSKNKLKTWLTSKTNDALFLTKKKYFEKFLKYLGWIKIKHVEFFSDYFPKYTLNRFYMIMIFLWIIAWLWSSGTGTVRYWLDTKSH